MVTMQKALMLSSRMAMQSTTICDLPISAAHSPGSLSLNILEGEDLICSEVPGRTTYFS